MYLYPGASATNQAVLAGELIVVTKTNVNHFAFEQTGKQQFQMKQVRQTAVPFNQDSNVYATEIDDRQILISNLPQSFADFNVDKQIYVYYADLAHQD